MHPHLYALAFVVRVHPFEGVVGQRNRVENELLSMLRWALEVGFTLEERSVFLLTEAHT